MPQSNNLQCLFGPNNAPTPKIKSVYIKAGKYSHLYVKLWIVSLIG